MCCAAERESTYRRAFKSNAGYCWQACSSELVGTPLESHSAVTNVTGFFPSATPSGTSQSAGSWNITQR